MPKVNPRLLRFNEKIKYLDILWTSIANLKTRQEVKNYFKDLLSESEAIMLGRRILIAKLLLEGKTYDQIVDETKAGHDTVGKVAYWLNSGFGGYEKAIKEFEKIIRKRKEIAKYKQEPAEPYSFEWLRRKYPLHFLLFNLFDAGVTKAKTIINRKTANNQAKNGK